MRTSLFLVFAWYRRNDAGPGSFNQVENNLNLNTKNKQMILLGDENYDTLPNLKKGNCPGTFTSLNEITRNL